ncbi:MAG: CoA transferase [Deltaproteobacteria bacterium]|nr:CoA transferase [Deltaproteobacteria bacterium]
MGGPLEGIRVVEIGVWVAGPAAGGILADWGADVVKIEPPGIGDPARMFQYMLGGDLPINPVFENDNRSKRSIVADLRTEEGRAIALDLIRGADVFLSNVRPAALARLGLDSDSLCERFPKLIYSIITGFGLEGPDKDKAAYDIAAFWARSGIAHSLTQPGSHPPHQRGGMGDHNVALAAASGICAALFKRERTGKGQVVSTSLLREGTFTLSFDIAVALRYGLPIQIGNRKTMGNPAINNYADSEGKYFWIVGLEGERHWPPLARAVGHPEWLDDPRYKDPRTRAENAEELIQKLDEIFATRTREEWAEIFDAEQDFWWAPVNSVEEVIADPQATAAGAFVEVPDGEGTTLLPSTPVDFGGTPWAPRAMAPSHGQHTDEILGEIGRSSADIDRLRDKGVLG